ncbi:serine hydrolase [Allomuricauda sp. d1]|uniref:serine hydrolase n=1 Tax=Allomuricauda sp. d1 TaxID=3136725 RepID=UPI0031DD8661
MKRTTLWPLLFLVAFIAYSQNAKKVKILDEMIQQGMTDWKIPGLAAVVVKNGEVVFKKTYGIKSIKTKGPVNGETLFAMASTTKAMVAMALGILVDEGKVDWNDKVVDHLPGFQLSDPYIAADARIKDLLTHNLGIANADVLWVLDSVTTSETLKRFKHTKKAYPLRGGFIYQNIMYAAAGEVIEALSGEPWHEFIKKRLFKPLNMNRSQAQAMNILKVGNYVTPHYNFEEDGVQVVDRNYSDQVGAAGMMWSSIDDISNYLRFILNRGMQNQDTILQPKTFETLFQPHTLIPENQFYPTTKLTKPNWLSYGLGWFQHDYRGEKLDFHTGSLPGLIAIAGVLHDKNTAVYVFGNMDHAELRHAILYQAMDLFAFEDDSTDWHSKIFGLYESRKKDGEKREQKQNKERNNNTKPTLALYEYIGIYQHPLIGNLEISVNNDILKLDFNKFDQVDASHWHYDTFSTIPNKRWTSPSKMTFHLNDKGEVATLDFMGYTFTKTD